MISMTAPTGKKIFLLSDPVEDWPRTWNDYKKNYQATFAAELMYPMINNYEVMPWPSRIFLGKFKLENNDTPQSIPKEYATQIQIMVNSLNDIPISKNKVTGSHGIGVLLSNSLMFQRVADRDKLKDPELSDLYGLFLPLLKRGIPVETVHMENLKYNSLKYIKVLLMTYSNMKPHSSEVHDYLAKWVKNGGVIIYVSKDDDEFQNVKEWWNSYGNNYRTPIEDLINKLEIKYNTEQCCYSSGKGKFIFIKNNPGEFVTKPNNDSSFVKIVKDSYQIYAKAGMLITKNNFYLERGNYILAAVMDESRDTSALHVKGPVIDLFSPNLPVISEKTVKPGEQSFLYSLKSNVTHKAPKVLCSSARIYNAKKMKNSYSFLAKGPFETMNVMRILLPKQPNKIIIDEGKTRIDSDNYDWSSATNTLLLRLDNISHGRKIKIEW
jgi:hypothetical protein